MPARKFLINARFDWHAELVLFSSIIIGVKLARFSKSQWLVSLANAKKHFRWEIFCKATIFSYFIVVLAYLCNWQFLSLKSESDCSDKKTTARSSWITSVNYLSIFITFRCNLLNVLRVGHFFCRVAFSYPQIIWLRKGIRRHSLQRPA